MLQTKTVSSVWSREEVEYECHVPSAKTFTPPFVLPTVPFEPRVERYAHNTLDLDNPSARGPPQPHTSR